MAVQPTASANRQSTIPTNCSDGGGNCNQEPPECSNEHKNKCEGLEAIDKATEAETSKMNDNEPINLNIMRKRVA